MVDTRPYLSKTKKGVSKMIKKSIIAVMAIVAVAGLIFAASGGTGSGDPIKDSESPEQQNNENAEIKNETSGGNKVISTNKAQEIAQKYIEEPGAKAGTPKLSNINGKAVYIVPVILNGEQVGEIEIDAETGENLGGAGGAP
jgi:uncharacterized membrane protein YkoI